jgi:ABC-type sugar transport system ATPase subunit
MNQMVKDGHALIFISHKLHEVVEISHRVTVLRDGRKIGTRPTSEITKQTLPTGWSDARSVLPPTAAMWNSAKPPATGTGLL